jgi:hypothetical protein
MMTQHEEARSVCSRGPSIGPGPVSGPGRPPSGYLRSTRLGRGVITSATELLNVPRAHLATGQAQAVPIYRSGTKGRSIIDNNEIYLLVRIFAYYRPPVQNLQNDARHDARHAWRRFLVREVS